MGRWERVSSVSPTGAMLAALAVGLALAPLVAHHYDVVDCFLTWARGSQGSRPWDIYLTHFKTECDYPPVVPYLLTVVERARLVLGAPAVGATSLILVKLPGLLAWAAHVPLCTFGLRRPFGTRVARIAAVLTALSLPLFVNAALWGQFDALLTLALVAAVVALLNRRPVWAGAALGLGLATKLLAVVAIPVLAVWTMRRHGVRAAATGALMAVLVVAALTAPYAVHGARGPVLASYRGAVGYYTFRTGEAYNVWYLLDRFDVVVRGLPPEQVKDDTRVLAGPITHRRVGLALFIACSAFLLIEVGRRPTATGLVLASCLQYFAFFMLPTQMHQRYVLPAAVLSALVAPLSARTALLFFGLTATATLNQGVDLGRAMLDHALTFDPSAVTNPAHVRNLLRVMATLVALVNTALIVWATVTLPKELGAASDGEPKP